MDDRDVAKIIENIKFYRDPWNKEKTIYLLKWWPHWGSKAMSENLGIPVRKIKAKKDKLKLRLLPKNKRICIGCENNTQQINRRHLYCNACDVSKRRKKRRERGVKQRFFVKDNFKWIIESAGRCRARKKNLRNNKDEIINTEYLINLWTNQNGKCYYSGFKMDIPEKGKKRNIYTASLDRIDPNKGYIKGNIVWCCWFYNNAKSNLTKKEFIKMCKKLVNRFDEDE
jgi:hypothetical protein